MGKMKKALALLLALALMVGALPAAFAAEEEWVYLSVSFDGRYCQDQGGAAMAYVPVSLRTLEAMDLEDYGMGKFAYDGDGDGKPDVTALQLYIYAHENLIGGDWADVEISGAAGSIFFETGLLGIDDCNLNYFYNGYYPEVNGWGVTADRLTLKSGDFVDVAGFSDWSFYKDSACGFHYFADANDNFTHAYAAQAEQAMEIHLVRSYSDAGNGAKVWDAAGREIYYGTTFGTATGFVVTDAAGSAKITFPQAGTWYLWCEGGYGQTYTDAIVSTPAYAQVTVTAATDRPTTTGRDVSAVLKATMQALADTVTEPVFGSIGGEWTVLALARGGYYEKDNAYFNAYYDRIVETVEKKASNVNMNGALHKQKSTDNSRLILALTAIGHDATAVGQWDLTAPYEDFDWVTNQGVNGPIWALIALDCGNYQADSADLRQKCVDYILEEQLADGGWALSGTTSDPDVTGMALQALAPYADQGAVAAAGEKGFDALSAMQKSNGSFATYGDETAESCAQVIVACAAWKINPDTDARFVKNGKSVVEAMLTYYDAESGSFEHILGAGTNAMAADQACYALVAYDRLRTGKNFLYDMTDVTLQAPADATELVATLGLPAEVNPGDSFRAVINISDWDVAGGYKLLDFILTVPEGLSVMDVTSGSRLSGGEVSYHLEEETGKLRVVYFDANTNADLVLSGTEFPAELFTVDLKAAANVAGRLAVAVTGMSLKRSSDSSDENAITVVNTETARGSVNVAAGISFSAVCLYEGDGVDLIPTDKKAVAVAVTGIAGGTSLVYNDGTVEKAFLYSPEITAKSGVPTYVALVDAEIEMENFVNASYFTLSGGQGESLTFGDANGDGVINAQDALAAVDAWLRKGEAPTEEALLILNVNGDSRLNTFDALGIVEKFVSGLEYAVVSRAASITTQQ